MKIRPLPLVAWVALFVIGIAAKATVLTPPAPVPAAAAIDQSPDNLALKQSLDLECQNLLQMYQSTEPGAEQYVAQYANQTVVSGSPEEAAGLAAYQQIKPGVDAYNQALAAYSTRLKQLRLAPIVTGPPLATRVNLYVDLSTLLARNDVKYNLARIQAEIDGIRQALATLDAVRNMNASQLEEWQKASADASNEAWKLGASMTIDLISANLKDRGDALDQQIEQQTGSLKTETDPDKVKQIQDSIDNLGTQKARLDTALEAVAAAQGGADQGESEAGNTALEKAWELASQTGALPPGASEAKDMVDSAYLVAVQCVSAVRVDAVNANADQYLKAVTSLSQKMKQLVDLKNQTAAANP